MKILQNGRFLVEKIRTDKRIWWLALIFVYSAVALSLWSNYLITNVMKCPFFLYEIYFIPPVLFCLKKSGMSFIRKFLDPRLFIAGGILVGFLAFGLIRNPSYFMAQITTFRVWIYFLVIIWFCFKNELPDLDTVFAACFGAVCGDTLFCLISPMDWVITPLNLMALAVVICIPLVKGHYGIFAVVLAVSSVDAFLSGFRIGFVVIAVSCFFGLLFSVVCLRRKKDFILCGIAVLGVIVFLVFFDQIAAAMQRVFHVDDFTFYRVTERLKALIRFDFAASQDTVRLENLNKPFDLFLQRLLPRGLIGKADGSYGMYKDIPIIFLYDSFGSIAAWFLSAFIGSVGVWNLYFSYKKRISAELGVLGAMFPVIVLLFLLNGCFLMDTYEVCISAVIIGGWLKSFFIRQEQEATLYQETIVKPERKE